MPGFFALFLLFPTRFSNSSQDSFSASSLLLFISASFNHNQTTQCLSMHALALTRHATVPGLTAWSDNAGLFNLFLMVLSNSGCPACTFPCCPKTKVSHQGPLGTARAHPCVMFKKGRETNKNSGNINNFSFILSMHISLQ